MRCSNCSNADLRTEKVVITLDEGIDVAIGVTICNTCQHEFIPYNQIIKNEIAVAEARKNSAD